MAAATAAPQRADIDELRASLRRLGREAARFAAGKLDDWQKQVQGVAEPAGPADTAVVAGLEAAATGKENPGRAALRAAWQAADTGTRTAVVATLLLLVVTAPLLVVVALVVLLLLALVLRLLRSDGRRGARA